MNKFVYGVLAVALAGTMTIGAGYAEQQQVQQGAPDEIAMEQAMEQAMQAATPGEKHQVLENLVGEWNYTISYRVSPEAPLETSNGTSQNQWILDGRFVQQDVAGQMAMGEETKLFKGMGLIGHDNLKNEYTSVWVDNMGTGTMTGEGSYDQATKVLEEEGTYTCPLKGGEVEYKSELKFVDNDHYTYTVYNTLPNGQQFKGMEIKYTRAQ